MQSTYEPHEVRALLNPVLQISNRLGRVNKLAQGHAAQSREWEFTGKQPELLLAWLSCTFGILFKKVLLCSYFIHSLLQIFPQETFQLFSKNLDGLFNRHLSNSPFANQLISLDVSRRDLLPATPWTQVVLFSLCSVSSEKSFSQMPPFCKARLFLSEGIAPYSTWKPFVGTIPFILFP